MQSGKVVHKNLLLLNLVIEKTIFRSSIGWGTKRKENLDQGLNLEIGVGICPMVYGIRVLPISGVSL